MIELNNKELMCVEGGAGITAAFLNAAARAVSTVVEIGRSLGTSLRRLISGSVCKI